jgi:hypothetical protein
LTLDPTRLGKAKPELGKLISEHLGRPAGQKSDQRRSGLLRGRRKRPRGRATDKRYELPYSPSKMTAYHIGWGLFCIKAKAAPLDFRFGS